jgi:hypothetical protein
MFGMQRVKTLIGLAATALTLVAGEAPATDVAMRRVLSCVGPDAKMEVYVPDALVTGTGVQNAKLDKQVVGAYSLDLSDAGKGKTLEPVHVQYSSDRKSVIVDQYTRKLRPTAVAVAGATVDFDQRASRPAPSADRSIRNEFRSAAWRTSNSSSTVRARGPIAPSTTSSRERPRRRRHRQGI